MDEFEINQVVTYKDKSFIVHSDTGSSVWLVNDKGEFKEVDAWMRQHIKPSDIAVILQDVPGHVVPRFL